MQNSICPAIVVATYNRPNALQRLLMSIARADYTGYADIPLVISIDGGGSTECQQIAGIFCWKHGEKRVIIHESNLGLKKHILSCGDLTEQYGAIIMLEEDVYVSPYFYDYSVQTTSYYQSESKIAGVSLFFLKSNETTGTPFIPLQNGYDVFFAQVPSSWGQTWTVKQWQKFRAWLTEHDNQPVSTALPIVVRKVWPSGSSWKKFFFSYMVENDLYFVMPYVAYATNMGEPGTHFTSQVMLFQTNLMLYPKQLRLLHFDKRKIVYDAYFELLPDSFHAKGVLTKYEVTIDLSGKKELDKVHTPYLLSIKPCRQSIATYSMCFSPIEVNILEGSVGGMINFGKTEDFLPERDENAYRQLMRVANEMVYHVSNTIGYRDGEAYGINIIKNTKNYRLGKLVLYPFRLLRRVVKKVL